MKDSRRGYGSLRMPRSRGAVSGLLLIGLGIWGALIPFVGPYFNFAFTPDSAWVWTSARGWLEVFPGVTAVVGGLLLMASGNRAPAMLGGWLATAAGAWLVVGRAFAPALRIGDAGQPIGVTDVKRAVVDVCYFSGLGALMVFLGGAVLARLAVRFARDVEVVPPAADLPPARETTPPPAPESEPPVSPDAPTQVRSQQAAAPEEHHRHGLFHRRPRAGTSAS